MHYHTCVKDHLDHEGPELPELGPGHVVEDVALVVLHGPASKFTLQGSKGLQVRNLQKNLLFCFQLMSTLCKLKKNAKIKLEIFHPAK